MIRGLYTSATSMISQYKKIDVLGNNIANINTDGFKREQVSIASFGDELLTKMGDTADIGSISEGVRVNAVTTDFTDGSLSQSNQTTDLGISGEGFYTVEDGGGVKYCRSGSFTVDAQGFLATATGERVIGTDGAPVYTGGSNFQVSGDGTVTVGGAQTAKIGLVTGAEGSVVRRRDGFYDINGATAAQGIIHQGYTEGSNSDAVTEMTDMLAATRSFQSSQQAFQTTGESIDQLISGLGSVKSY